MPNNVQRQARSVIRAPSGIPIVDVGGVGRLGAKADPMKALGAELIVEGIMSKFMVASQAVFSGLERGTDYLLQLAHRESGPPLGLAESMMATGVRISFGRQFETRIVFDAGVRLREGFDR
jgi:hypothetical protein